MTTELSPVGVATYRVSCTRQGTLAFYAEHYDGLSARLSYIEDLPPVTKRELMDRFDDWVTDRQVRGRNWSVGSATSRVWDRTISGDT